MAKVKFTIDSIFEGMMPSALFGGRNQYLDAIGIDPDIPLTDATTDLKASGSIRPTAYSTFSGANVTSYPIAIITNPIDTKIYVVLKNGRIISYDNAYGSETLVATVTGGNAEGAFYYNNYIYVTGVGTLKNDVSRYGPLNSSPALVDNVWTGATLGALTALTNTTYPYSLLSVPYPNHWGVVHIDNAAYFLDYAETSGETVGLIHKIKTKTVTQPGDTNNGSSFGVVRLPMNYLPMTICSYGNNIVVSATQSPTGGFKQGRAALFFFNPADTISSFYQICFLPDAFCSVLWYENGRLFGISGDQNGGYRLFESGGGTNINTLAYIEEGNPPLQGAASSIAEKLVWASDKTIPIVSSGLYGYGSKSGLLPKGLHNIVASPLS